MDYEIFFIKFSKKAEKCKQYKALSNELKDNLNYINIELIMTNQKLK